MTTLLTLGGLAIGILIFLNLLHSKARFEGMDLSTNEDNAVRGVRKDGSTRVKRTLANAPSRRICPVCRTPLTPDEYLLCAMDRENKEARKRQVHIYGCPHCFITDGVNVKGTDTVALEKIADFNV